MTAPLSPKLLAVLAAVADGRDCEQAPNEIAEGCGFRPGHARAKRGRGNGRGNGHRVMGPAVHVTRAVVALQARGLMYPGSRSDGLSGTAYGLTGDGERIARSAEATAALAELRAANRRRKRFQ